MPLTCEDFFFRSRRVLEKLKHTPRTKSFRNERDKTIVLEIEIIVLDELEVISLQMKNIGIERPIALGKGDKEYRKNVAHR